ncbi:MAG TPA: LytTR family DNA-binding domain-containing protein, partial [Defluviitaleaceae bacterium]|nr:LytTR family DNA-binding domain-containing protein [Defluviitaleaceae bacterium]
MQIEVKIDRSCTEPKVIIVTDKITDEINHLMKKLSDDSPQMLSGFKDDMLEIIDESDIISVYACSGKVFDITEKGEYTLRLKLYEIEERLDKNYFVR